MHYGKDEADDGLACHWGALDDDVIQKVKHEVEDNDYGDGYGN